MSATKHRSSAGKSVAIFFIVFIILEALIIFGVSRAFKDKDDTLSVAGYSMYIMDSDAMGDAVPKGSLVIASIGSPSAEGVKKAILCKDVPGVGTSVFWLADVSTSSDLNGVIYTVFQENDPKKLYELKTQNVIGTATTYYETAGKIITFMTSKFGMILLIAAPLFLMVLIELIIMVVNRTRYSDDDDEDDYEDEDDEEEPVKLDDFLFGGQHDEELIKDRVRSGEEAAADITFGDSVPVRKGKGRRADDDDDYEEEKAPVPANPEDIFDAPLPRSKHAKTKRPAEPEVEDEPEIKDEPAEEPVPEEKPVEKAAEPAEEPVKVSEPEPEKPARSSDIHPSYYEKASKLIDEGEDAAAEVEVTPVKPAAPAPAPVKESKPAPKPEPKPAKPDMKKVSAGFEDLMKLMEMETGKLKNQIDSDDK